MFPMVRNNAVFINLQYDDACDELESIQKSMGVEIMQLNGLDLYNDFEGIVAVMENLDVILAPCTVMAELGKCVGVPTLLMSPTMDMNFRIYPDSNRDVLYRNVEIIYPDVWGDKNSLIHNTAQKLKNI